MEPNPLGVFVFILGIVLGLAVSPWLFLLCALPVIATWATW